ncbi:hypothetical protein RB195_025807 [Necator americanus]|uniref:Uncharacterized protein n=1 Tax=Necator americanus TaxID=51031 RepID=A0ABR1EU03_NECAM
MIKTNSNGEFLLNPENVNVVHPLDIQSTINTLLVRMLRSMLTYECWSQNRCSTPIAFVNAEHPCDVPASHIRTLEYGRKVGEAIIPREYRFVPEPFYQPVFIPQRSTTPLPLNDPESEDDMAALFIQQKGGHFETKQRIIPRIPELGPIPIIYSVVQSNENKTLVDNASLPTKDTCNMSFWELLVREMNEASPQLHPCLDPSNYTDYGEAKPKIRKSTKKRIGLKRGLNYGQKRCKTATVEVNSEEQETVSNVFHDRNVDEQFRMMYTHNSEHQITNTTEYSSQTSMHLNSMMFKSPLLQPPASYYCVPGFVMPTEYTRLNVRFFGKARRWMKVSEKSVWVPKIMSTQRLCEFIFSVHFRKLGAVRSEMELVLDLRCVRHGAMVVFGNEKYSCLHPEGMNENEVHSQSALLLLEDSAGTILSHHSGSGSSPAPFRLEATHNRYLHRLCDGLITIHTVATGLLDAT